MNNIILRGYQLKALESFKNNNWKGILDMATGTGKTITSLAISNKYKNEYGRVFLVILVPFTHLIEQWIENCNNAGYRGILKCYGSKNDWIDELQSKVRDYNIGITDVQCVISTYKSASAKEFNYILSELNGPSFIIGDECHYFGIRSLKNHKLNNFKGRLGLSATPDRWWDEEGTVFLKDYFGETVYEYSMDDAIKNGALTEYRYTPMIVDLTEEEKESYKRYTKMLINIINSKDKDSEKIEEINRKRSLIISKAKNKKELLFKIFEGKNIEYVKHTLIYCAPGEVNEITSNLSDIGYKVHRFDSHVSTKNRQKILEYFESGEIQILVAIKCLDEGVDIPATKSAYFLASTSNPREFIQRRGRVLRRYKEKNIAEIYDFIVIPESSDYSFYKTVVSKELPRFAEFSRYAINEFDARDKISFSLRINNLEHLMDKLPWDVYKEMKEFKEEKEWI